MPLRHVLISGATGFIGQRLVETLADAGHRVSAIARSRLPKAEDPRVSWIQTGDLIKTSIDPANGTGVDVFIHLASPLRPTSTDASGDQSDAAAIARNVSAFVTNAGIKRVIVLSSIAASLAERNDANSRRYGLEKLAAEKVIRTELAGDQRIVFLRPPAVYGPRMRNSLALLAALVRKGVPIPLGAANQTRHYISIRNLCELIEAIVRSDDERWESSSGKVFEPSDGQAIETNRLIKMIGEIEERPARLIPVPIGLLRLIAGAAGKSELISGAVDRLDVAPVEELNKSFGWRPIERMPESLAFLAHQASA